ncbi:uncharacterized protein LOC126829656 isoform X3 [Patella vulgata]|uniref:uncharacterized protein LOC126829656 isoform X3 n=1 Tax=Patella vulgata TaxID=6465 RepID=UPI0024A8F980|nr:uncharacterized protein LOC126829656 isoform X3 [Patella vulgata]
MVRCIGLTSPGPHVFVVFTCKNKLDCGDVTLEQYLDQCPEEIKSIIDECKGRCVAINNYADPVNLAKDVEDVLKVFRGSIQSNNGKYYTGTMYEAAEEIFKEKMQKIEEEKHKRERELDEKERKLEDEMKEKTQKVEKEAEKQRLKDEENQRNKRKLEERRLEIEREKERKNKEIEDRKRRLDEKNKKRKKLAVENHKKRIDLDGKIEEQKIGQNRLEGELKFQTQVFEMVRKQQWIGIEQRIIENQRRMREMVEQYRRLNEECRERQKTTVEAPKKRLQAEAEGKTRELEEKNKGLKVERVVEPIRLRIVVVVGTGVGRDEVVNRFLQYNAFVSGCIVDTPGWFGSAATSPGQWHTKEKGRRNQKMFRSISLTSDIFRRRVTGTEKSEVVKSGENGTPLLSSICSSFNSIFTVYQRKPYIVLLLLMTLSSVASEPHVKLNYTKNPVISTLRQRIDLEWIYETNHSLQSIIFTRYRNTADPKKLLLQSRLFRIQSRRYDWDQYSLTHFLRKWEFHREVFYLQHCLQLKLILSQRALNQVQTALFMLMTFRCAMVLQTCG